MSSGQKPPLCFSSPASSKSEANNQSQNSSWSSTRLFCRICHEGDRHFPLISPCACSGSIGAVHQHCLERWLSTVNKENCELCGSKFEVKKRPKSVTWWLFCTPFSDEHRNLVGDLICFFVLTPLSLVSAFLCYLGAFNHLDDRDDQWTAIALFVIASFLVLIYLIWITITIRFQIKSLLDWRKDNQDIRLHVTEQPV